MLYIRLQKPHGAEITKHNLSYVYDYFDKHTFLCEMFLEGSDIILELMLNFFPIDNSVEIINTKKGKKLLKRTHYPYLKEEMLQIGNTILIFSKVLLIVGCAPLTMKVFYKNAESTFAMMKPQPHKNYGKIITFILNKGFRITNMKNGRLDMKFAMKLYSSIQNSQTFPIIMNYATSSDVIGLELEAPDAVKYWRSCLGGTDPKTAAPGTLRALFGVDIIRNVAHGVSSREVAKEALKYFFGKNENGEDNIPLRATCKDCTCCIIKPHVLTDGTLGQIMEMIIESGKFVITAMSMFAVDLNNAKEFYEVYKGVLPEYDLMAIQLTEGKSIVMEVKCIDPKLNAVSEFRKLCGPREPDICRQLYPDTIRALYGKNLTENAVHCTDLPEDGELEVEYFFKLIQSSSNI